MEQHAAPIAVPSLALPKGGGGIRGLGQAFQPNEFTGTMTLSVPIAIFSLATI